MTSMQSSVVQNLNMSALQITIILIIIVSAHGRMLVNKAADICASEACLDTAESILGSIDYSVNPCDDFYTFACGNWIRLHPVPSTETHWNQFDILDSILDKQVHQLIEESITDEDLSIEKAVKTIYWSCMDKESLETQGVSPLIELLDTLGGWPIAGWHFDASVNLWTSIARATNLLAVTPLLFAYVDVDRKHTERNILTIDQPSLTLPRYAYVETKTVNLDAYVRFIQQVAQEVAKTRGFGLNSLEANAEAKAILKFETQLARITTKDELRRDSRKMYHLLTIRELQELTDNLPLNNQRLKIDWMKFLNHVLGPRSVLSSGTEIVVMDIDYLQRLFKLIDCTPLRVIVNYIQWRVVKTMSRDLNQHMRELNFRFKQQISQVKEDHPRWRECVLSASYMSLAVGYMYVTRHFGFKGKEKAVTMVENIRAAFREELQEINWMDEETKLAALEKADYMVSFIGYPNWFNDSSAVNLYYQGIGTDHFKNVIRLREFLVRKMMDKLWRPTRRDEWQTSPAVVNAFYNPYVNSIIFPAGILQRPFFSHTHPKSLNYGSIGAVMGHEITHGFDDMGRQSDKLGNIHQWWTEETEKTYMRNAQCFIDQYQNYRISELDTLMSKKVTINGILTLGENIADNGGLKAAYRAYKLHNDYEPQLFGLQQFTSDQLFFLGFANVWCESPTLSSLMAEVMGDTHSPHKYRVIGTLSNSEEFSAAWDCPLGSRMNPVTKCQLW